MMTPEIKLTRVNAFIYSNVFYSWMKPLFTAKLIDKGAKKEKGNDKNTDLSEPRFGVRYTKDMYAEVDDGGCIFLAGLYPEFVKEARKRGYSFSLQEGRELSPDLNKPCFDLLDDGLRYRQDEVIQKITQNDKGIIKCSTGFGKSFIIKQLCKIYPTLRIVITTSSAEVVDDLYTQLKSLLGANEVGKLSSGTPSVEEMKRVVVSTVASLRRAPLEICDLFLFDEVHAVGDNKTADVLINRMGKARMFGFTASLSRGDNAVILIRALFGQVLASVDYQEAAEHGLVTKITAMMAKCRIDRNIPVINNLAIDERNNYWRNRERNQLIASIASNISEEEQCLISVKTLEHAIYLKSVPELRDYRIMHYGNVPKPEKKLVPFTLENAPRGGVTVVSKRTGKLHQLQLDEGDAEHFAGYRDEAGKFYSFFAAMQSFLFPQKPSESNLVVPTTQEMECAAFGQWVLEPVLINGIDVAQFKMTPKERRNLRTQFERGEVLKMIATYTLKEGVNINGLKYLIRADGGVSDVICTQFPGRLSRLQEGKKVAMLIDLYDDFNSWVRLRSELRMKHYRAKGWLR